MSAVYQVKVTLRGARPPIWRRLLVRSDLTLAKLHDVLHVAFGWEDDHLHQFVAGGTMYSVPMDGMEDVLNEKKHTLAGVCAGKGSTLVYEYDFGDSWEHDIVVEKVEQTVEHAKAAVCIEGKRAGPPEDCGGVWGYAELVECLKDPEKPENAERLEWLGEFVPEKFEVGEVNRGLGRVK